LEVVGRLAAQSAFDQKLDCSSVLNNRNAWNIAAGNASAECGGIKYSAMTRGFRMLERLSN